MKSHFFLSSSGNRSIREVWDGRILEDKALKREKEKRKKSMKETLNGVSKDLGKADLEPCHKQSPIFKSSSSGG